MNNTLHAKNTVPIHGWKSYHMSMENERSLVVVDHIQLDLFCNVEDIL